MQTTLNISFRLAGQQDLADIKRLWRLSFTDDEEYLQTFFLYGFPLTNTFVASHEDQLISSLSIFNNSYKGYPGGYLYGVCTDPKYRGNKISVSLINYSKIRCRESGMKYLITKPASSSLINFYRDLGFNNVLPVCRIKIISKKQVDNIGFFENLTGEILNRLRYDAIKNPLVEWPDKVSDYILRELQMRSGKIALHNAKKYIVGYQEEQNNSLYHILETNLHFDPISEKPEEYVLALSLDPCNISSLMESDKALFNFPME